MASNFPGLKDPRRQSRLGRLADRDVELGHAREWSRERLAAARRAEDEAATYKAATRRDIAGATESTGLGRAPSDALRENLEKALVKPSLLGMTAPLSLSVPTTTAGKVIGGGIGAALGGIGGEDPYFSALSMLHPTLAMAQMANVAYRDEPILPISDAHGAKFPFLSKQGIQRLLNHYAYGMAPEASKAALGRVSASDFLNATVPGEESLARIVKRTGGRYDPYWEGRSSHPMLYLDDDGRIIGHEGRHRIAGLSQAVGENVEVPVVFRRYSRSSPEDFEAIPRMVPGQQFESGTGMPFVRENLTPISYANEGALSKYLTEFDVPLTKLRVGLPGDMPEIPANTNPLKFAGGGSVAGAAKRLAQRAMSQAGDVDPVVAPRGALSVIKNKGGNWLTGSVEDSLSRLKVEGRRGYIGGELPPGMYDLGGDVVHILPDNSTRQWTPREHAINSWIDKQLTRYVKNEMATPEDPIRALAERGVLHYDQPYGGGVLAQAHRRFGNISQGGTQPTRVAVEPLAQRWEDISDAAILPGTNRTHMPFKTPGEDWNSAMRRRFGDWAVDNPDLPAYVMDRGISTRELGFDHLLDELRNAMNPESGLPRHLLLDPNSLPRVSVPQAVERVSAINAWRAAQKAEADALKANNAATVLFKEYPENNPLGLRWVELKAPSPPEGWVQEGEAWRHPDAWRKEVAKEHSWLYPKDALADALKYEGDTMGHCVGGYCDDVLSGRTRIYSLRDAKGQPHVTIETRPTGITRDLEDEAIAAVAREHPDVEEGSDLMADLISAKLDALEAERFIAGDHQIIQIKGKQNRAPNPEYLPFVQDFVKSGQWSAVGDLRNAGMLELRQPVTVRGDAREITIPTGRYAPEDLRQYFESPEVHPELSEAQLKAFLERHGFAAGGLARIAARTGKDAAPVRKGIGSIIKEKGGNWLTGSVEDVLSVLRRTEDVPPVWDFALESNTRGAALNSWIDKQLTRYIKNEMATPEDPVRALAERGILHFTPLDDSYLPGVARGMRARAGTPLDGVAQGPLAKHWENLSDYDIHTQPAGQLREHLETKVYPWLLKLPEETPVYQPTHSDSFTELGFDHLLDELSNAMNPASGLPRNLQLDPKSMARVSVPQAVERVSAINAWRAAQKAEADALRANNAATQVYKEYPENNPLGLRWVELKKGDGVPEGYQLIVDESSPGIPFYQYKTPQGRTLQGGYSEEEARQIAWGQPLSDALKYEGDTMGHCVGGYCDDVLSGRTKIYSLRDAKGQPHVTVEVAPMSREEFIAKNARDVNDMRQEGDDFANRWIQRSLEKAPQRIVQIKGKQNRAPNPEYLPFVQDFVKSGQWSDVGDLKNAGLIRHTGERAKNLGEYSTEQELNDYLDKFMPEKKAQGGLVEAMIEQNLDAMVEKQTPRQMSRGGSVRTPIRAKIEKMTSELRQCRN